MSTKTESVVFPNRVHEVNVQIVDTGTCERGCCNDCETRLTCTCGWSYKAYGSKDRKEIAEITDYHEREIVRALLGFTVKIKESK